jgi:hypothetical protein
MDLTFYTQTYRRKTADRQREIHERRSHWPDQPRQSR